MVWNGAVFEPSKRVVYGSRPLYFPDAAAIYPDTPLSYLDISLSSYLACPENKNINISRVLGMPKNVMIDAGFSFFEEDVETIGHFIARKPQENTLTTNRGIKSHSTAKRAALPARRWSNTIGGW